MFLCNTHAALGCAHEEDIIVDPDLIRDPAPDRKDHEMKLCTPQFGLNANLGSTRAVADRFAMWHRGSNAAIPTVGTAFKPYDQRPKERFL